MKTTFFFSSIGDLSLFSDNHFPTSQAQMSRFSLIVTKFCLDIGQKFTSTIVYKKHNRYVSQMCQGGPQQFIDHASLIHSLSFKGRGHDIRMGKQQYG
jgi:hypothetical protein